METSTKVLVATGAVAVTAAVAASGALKSTGVGPKAEAPTPHEAARFLTQATWGPTDADIASVQALGFAGWIDAQIELSRQSGQYSTRAYFTQRQQTSPPGHEARLWFNESFYQRAANGPDQLRQRMQFALSQIFVVSRTLALIDGNAMPGTAAYYDILGKNALGNFRTLLEDVTYSPIMGMFLTYVQNQKEDESRGRHPDENYAREVMQLMTIGTVLLNEDGSPQLTSDGSTIPAYEHADIEGLAKVFTGLSWPVGGFFSGSGYDQQLRVYPQYHSTSEKRFLGTTIPATTSATDASTRNDIRIALDTLFNHPNVGPFIGRRLIQQFVTSNPSPAYISRITQVFNDNGEGVRGDLAAVIRAVLLDEEARDTQTALSDPDFGKLREPLIRLLNWMRIFKARSLGGYFCIHKDGIAGDTNRPRMGTGFPSQLGQAPLNAPSVFNFWRPGYSPPNTAIGRAGLVAPEMQAVSELSSASYIGYMRGVIDTGVGFYPLPTWHVDDVVSSYADEVELSATPEALLDRLNTLLFYGQMSLGLRQKILTAVNSVRIPTSPTDAAKAKLNRAKLAIFLAMVSGEYLVQR